MDNEHSAFSVMLYELGVRLMMTKTALAGSNIDFVRAHTTPINESIRSGIRTIPAKDILLLQVILAASKDKSSRKPIKRPWVYYVSFLSKLKKYYILKNPRLGTSVFGTFDSNR